MRNKFEKPQFWIFWAKMANFRQFLAKIGKTGFFSKKRSEHFSRAYKPQLTAKFQKKVMVFEKLRDERMNERTDVNPYVSNDTVERPKSLINHNFEPFDGGQYDLY